MLSRFAIFVFVASLICAALASPMGDLQKRANTSSTVANAISTKNAKSGPTSKPTKAAVTVDYSGIKSKSTNPLHDGWTGLDLQSKKGKTFW